MRAREAWAGGPVTFTDWYVGQPNGGTGKNRALFGAVTAHWRDFGRQSFFIELDD